MKKVRATRERDLADGWGRVLLPDALDRLSASRPRQAGKYPNAPKDWLWPWVFPQENRWKNQKTGEAGRHHVHESIIQKAVNGAVRKAGFAKRATGHTFRHSCATQLLESGDDIRTVQELLGHKDVRTTMIYAHVRDRGGKGVKSPVDDLSRRSEGAYAETTYPAEIVAECSTMHCEYRRYARMVAGVLYHAVAPQRCYEESVQPLLCLEV